MTRGQSRNNKHKNKARLSQTPKKDILTDEELSEELSEINHEKNTREK
ncbi:YfhD family protein [Thalassorhabdus alkalitolerans]|uniref:YfhD family protein n=1 Tax=Thalassorhabdus alkalitolerans TaxID=2282697 RepID=A0ABW0YST3_9BACI|nr:YfhD family protein [Thalassobacillus sp. C254]